MRRKVNRVHCLRNGGEVRRRQESGGFERFSSFSDSTTQRTLSARSASLQPGMTVFLTVRRAGKVRAHRNLNLKQKEAIAL